MSMLVKAILYHCIVKEPQSSEKDQRDPKCATWHGVDGTTWLPTSTTISLLGFALERFTLEGREEEEGAERERLKAVCYPFVLLPDG